MNINMANGKLLKDLKVSELKSELEERDLDMIGIKTQLVKRLMEALVDEGKNPDEYRFACAEGVGSVIAKMEERVLDNSIKMKERTNETFRENEKIMLEKIMDIEENLRKMKEDIQKALRKIEEVSLQCDEKLEKFHKKIAHLESTLENIQTSGQISAVAERKSVEIRRTILESPEFDGKSLWDNYQRQFEAAAKANGWTSG